MKVYTLFLALAAVGVLVVLVRWALHWMKERGAKKGHAVRHSSSAASRAERDRADCRALEMKLGAGASNPEPARPSLGALRESSRGSTANESSFDPDLPARG